ncbi:MAG: aldo/keto reductase [Eubacterium sp.]|nr:aldo/keto reductase [Eubacterium sp.]
MMDVKLNNGKVIPTIGTGTYPYKELLADSLPVSLKTGFRLIDTSDNYGNETFVGVGLVGADLSDLVVISKFSQPLRTHELEKCFEESKEKIGALNIYLLHWPYPYLWKQQWRKMEDLYLKGKCDAIGVCNFDLGYMKELLSFCRVKPAINQFERHPLFQQQDLVNFCHANEVAVMAYSPVARMDKGLQESPILKEIAEKYNKTVNQVILRWDVDTNCIPIPASSSEKHINENYDIFDFELNKSEIEKINSLEAGNRIRFNPRTRFSFKKKLLFLISRCRMLLQK